MFPGGNALCERRGVHIGIFRYVQPVVVDDIACPFLCGKFQPVGSYQPFMACLLLSSYNTIEIVDVCTSLYGLAQLACPMESVNSLHLMLFRLSFCDNVQHQFLAESRLILKIKCYSHICL